MAWFRGLFQRKAITSASGVLRELIEGAQSRSGASVTLKTAIEAQAVLACARVVAEGLAQVPLKVYRPMDGGGSEPATDLPLYRVLYRRPNEFQTAYELREMAGLHLTLTGNFFAFINRVRGEPHELLPYDPGAVTVKRDEQWQISYSVQTKDGKPQPIPAADMLHLRGPSLNGWMGLDATRVAREAIGLSLVMEEHEARFFSNGANGGDLLTTDQPLKDEQVQRLKKQWAESYAGTANAYKTAVMWGGMKWQSRMVDNKLSQLHELRGFQIEDICQRFRVNPIMIGYSGEKTPTYASAEQMFLAHVVHCLGPWYVRLEQAMDVYLLTPEQQAAGYYCRHTVAGLLRGAHKDRAEFYRTLHGVGALNPNEIRGYEELNPYEGGDAYQVPLNMTPAGSEPTEDNT